MKRKGFNHSPTTRQKMSVASCRQPRIDLSGKKINKLQVAWPVGYSSIGQDASRPWWLCFCECGNFKIFEGRALRRKRNRQLKSCGCIRRNVDSSFTNLFAQYRHKARARKLEWSLTLDQFKILVTSVCYYTGRPPQLRFTPKGKNPSPSIMWNGVDRLDNSKGYTVENCVPCWGVVNKMKLTMSEQEFVSICSEIHKHKENNNATNSQLGRRQLSPRSSEIHFSPSRNNQKEVG